MKLRRFQPKLITEVYFPHHKKPITINDGECFVWAYLCFHTFVGVEIWHNPGHAFVRHGGKFYDSERIKGERDFRDLPAIGGCDAGTCRMSQAQFKKEWRPQPPRFNTHLEPFEKNVCH